jgi:hypothetical protein
VVKSAEGMNRDYTPITRTIPAALREA